MFNKLYKINMSISDDKYMVEFSIFGDLVKYKDLLSSYIYTHFSNHIVYNFDNLSYTFGFIDEAEMFFYLSSLAHYIKLFEKRRFL